MRTTCQWHKRLVLTNFCRRRQVVSHRCVAEKPRAGSPRTTNLRENRQRASGSERSFCGSPCDRSVLLRLAEEHLRAYNSCSCMVLVVFAVSGSSPALSGAPGQDLSALESRKQCCLDLTVKFKQSTLLLGCDVLVPEEHNASVCNEQSQLSLLRVCQLTQLDSR